MTGQEHSNPKIGISLRNLETYYFIESIYIITLDKLPHNVKIPVLGFTNICNQKTNNRLR